MLFTLLTMSLQFLILLITLVATFLRYVLFVIDSRMDGNWNNKFTYLFYLELISEILKLITYLVSLPILVRYCVLCLFDLIDIIL